MDASESAEVLLEIETIHFISLVAVVATFPLDNVDGGKNDAEDDDSS